MLMPEPPLPNWFSIFGEGLQRQLNRIEDSLTKIDTKADAIHDETRRTNGRVTSHDGRLAVLERVREEGTMERRHKHEVFGGPLVGAVGAIVLLLIGELIKHLL